MTFIKEHTGKNLVIPAALMELSGFGHEGVEMHAQEGMVAITKKRMTGMEMIRTIDELARLASVLATHLARACGPCEECGMDDGCPREGSCQYVSLPEFLRKEAGIPPDAKLCAAVDEEERVVTIMEAEHAYDLRDVPAGLLSLFASSGTCLEALEECLISGGIVYGG